MFCFFYLCVTTFLHFSDFNGQNLRNPSCNYVLNWIILHLRPVPSKNIEKCTHAWDFLIKEIREWKEIHVIYLVNCKTKYKNKDIDIKIEIQKKTCRNCVDCKKWKKNNCLHWSRNKWVKYLLNSAPKSFNQGPSMVNITILQGEGLFLLSPNWV